MSEATTAEDGAQVLAEGLPAGWQERLGAVYELDPTQIDWLGDESGRIAGNLLVLLQRGWPEIASIGGRLALTAAIGVLLTGLAAAILSWLLYLVAAGPLLRRGWRTGRLIGCCAATAVVLCAATGGAWAGLWLGVGWTLEEAIEERYVVERLAAATYIAFTLDQDEMPPDLSAAQVEALLGRAQRRSAASWESFRANAALAEGGPVQPRAWLRPELMVRVVETLGGGAEPDLLALHRVLTVAPDAGGAALPQTAAVRRQAVGILRGGVYGQVATALGFGLVLPLAALALLGLLGLLLSARPGSGRGDVSSAAAR